MKKLLYLLSLALLTGSSLFLSTCKKDEPDKPTITTLTPASGHEGDVIDIAGTFLGSAKKVKFGSVDAVVIDPKGGVVTTQVPAGLTLGDVQVTVQTDGGSSNALTFKVIPPAPEITSINPIEGGAGMTVAITGKFFGTAKEVAFGTTKVTTLDTKSETQVTIKVPDGLTLGATDVTVTTDGGTSNAISFTVLVKPTITNFTPAAGPAGTHVIITGTNIEGTTHVFFGTTEGTFTPPTSTFQLDAVVPASPTSGKIKIITPGGEALSATDFIAKGAPIVTSFTPTSGLPGAEVTITGQNFSVPGAIVKFGATLAITVTVNSDTEIKATVPAGTVTGKVSVTTLTGTGTSATDFTIVGAPNVASFAPVSAAIGSTVTINGTNFINVSSVKFNTTEAGAANITVISPTQLTAKVPAGASNGVITVTTPAGVGSSATPFIVVGAPTITSFTPTSGVIGASITINGTSLTTVTSVKFNTTVVTSFTVDSSIKITAAVPAGATSGPITVISPGGTGISSSNFTVVGAPTITSFTPSSGAIGQSVTITGASFLSVTAVKFNGTAAVSPTVTPTQITATIPAGATTGKISVETTAAGTAQSATNFTVIAAPTVASFNPTSGGVGGTVTITGTNFFNVSSVKFNATEVGAANYTVVSLTQISATVPAGATTGKISVTTPSGTGTSAGNFTVVPPPTISSFTPTSGPVGASVVITGTSFTGASAVKFNNTTSTYTVNGPTQITATVPAGATTGPISVTNAAGSVNSATNFTVLLAPFISSISPITGTPGTTLTITGTSLAGATSVKFNGTTVTTLISNTDVQIKVAVPAISAGAVNVSVVTAGGTSNTKTFTVVPAPVITDLKPNISYKGFPIMIRGSNLAGVVSAKVGTVDAVIMTKYDATVIITIPGSMANGTYNVTVSNDGGPSNGVSLNIITAPAGVGSPPTGTFVSPPPANFVNAISNFWSGIGQLGTGSGSQCPITNPNYPDYDPQYVCGYYHFTKNGAGQVIANDVTLSIGTGPTDPNMETFYGQWSATLPDPCIQKLFLISTKDGHTLTATVNVDGIDIYGTGECH